jgi:hypothetical protein
LRKQWEGEGPLLQTPPYPLQHKIQITYQLFIAKTNDAIPLSFQPRGAAGVGCDFFQRLMGDAVNFDNELYFPAAEIRKEGTDRNLA